MKFITFVFLFLLSGCVLNSPPINGTAETKQAWERAHPGQSAEYQAINDRDLWLPSEREPHGIENFGKALRIIGEGMTKGTRQRSPVAQPMSSRDEFCDGFAIGYKTIKGNLTIVPICPIPPITPIGSTPYQEGLKAGISAAR